MTSGIKDYRRIKLCYFNPASAWSFVTAVTGSYYTLPVGFTSAGEGVEEDRRGGTTTIREVGAVTL